MGMKEELVRTNEENERYRQLVETNRRRRKQLLQQGGPENQLDISQVKFICYFRQTVQHCSFSFPVSCVPKRSVT